MLYEYYRHIILSFIIISLLHYLWIYLRDNFTVKKTKNVSGNEIEKYKKIIDEMEKNISLLKDNNNSVNDELTETDKKFLEDDLDEFIMNIRL
jgi:hypothetical protein